MSITYQPGMALPDWLVEQLPIGLEHHATVVQRAHVHSILGILMNDDIDEAVAEHERLLAGMDESERIAFWRARHDRIVGRSKDTGAFKPSMRNEWTRS
jgi:hypothetical protein